MRKLYKNILFAAASMLSITATSQNLLSAYSFTQLPGTYSAITTGTAIGNTGSDDDYFTDPNNPTASFGANSGVGFAIGFTFTYNLIPYDKIGVNSNGWISLGQSSVTPNVNMATGSAYTPISNGASGGAVSQAKIAGFAFDLLCQAGGGILLNTIGTAPTRTCVIQFTNYRRWSGGAGDGFNFQIRLMETTNVIEVMYGGFVVGTGGSAAEVGLHGVSNADFANRQVTATGQWSASVSGPQGANCTFNAGPPQFVPANGQTYRWTPPPPCAGIPPVSALISPTTTQCFGSQIPLSIAPNVYTATGYSFQWQSSTISPVGPFTNITGATGQSINTPTLNGNTWYQAVITCANGGQTGTTTAAAIVQQSLTVNTPPYLEDFESIYVNNQLPNCSWTSSGSGGAPTYTNAVSGMFAYSGSKYGAFVYSPAGTYSYCSNGLNLTAGITYSASMMFRSDYYGYPNHTLTILVGPSQSATNQTVITGASPAVSTAYKGLGGTFQVATSGVYYITIKDVTSAGFCCPASLTWDDLRVDVPCSANAPSVTINANSNVACQGSALSFTAAGTAGAGGFSYNWGNGNNNPVYTFTPNFSANYNVIATNTLTGCTASASILGLVNPLPNVSILTNGNNSVCKGSSFTLTAAGADAFSWSNGGTSGQIVVSPTTTTTYSVSGILLQTGCQKAASITVSVNPLPTIIASGNNNQMCVGETLSLSASGAGATGTYTWVSNNALLIGSAVIVSPPSSTSYTVSGTDNKGCVGTANYAISVSPCTGINEVTAANGLMVYPNPSKGVLTVVCEKAGSTLEMVDMTGRVVLSAVANERVASLDIKEFANGIYYLKVRSNASVEVVKVIKD